MSKLIPRQWHSFTVLQRGVGKKGEGLLFPFYLCEYAVFCLFIESPGADADLCSLSGSHGPDCVWPEGATVAGCFSYEGAGGL